MNPESSFSILFVIISIISSEICEGANNCDENTECCTPGCMAAANYLQYNMDRRYDPCDNFYGFACGGYATKTYLGWDEFKNYYSPLQKDIDKLISDLIPQPITEKDHLPTRLLKQTYSLCTDTGAIDETSVSDLLELFDEVGGMPLLSKNWNETGFALEDYLISLLQKGFTQESLFSIKISGSEQEGYQFHLGKADFGKRFYLLLHKKENRRVKSYTKYMRSVLTALGGNATLFQDELEEILDFEMQLAYFGIIKGQYFDTDDDYPDLTFTHDGEDFDIENSDLARFDNIYYEDIPTKYTTVGELNERLPGFPWVEYIKKLYLPYYNLTMNESVAIKYPVYYEHLSNFTKYTKIRTLSNFLLWRLADWAVPALSSQIRQFKRTFIAEISGDYESEKRKEICMAVIQKSFKVEIGFMYIMHSSRSHLQSARDIAENIRTVYLETFENATWLSTFTRQEAIKKAENMRFDISHPAFLDNITFVDEYYSDLKTDTQRYFKKFLELAKFELNKILKNRFQKGLSVDIKFLESLSRATSYYDREGNVMGIPSSILEGIFFDHDRTNYLNYGGIGSVMAREISHGFDPMGRRYDYKGAERNWWDNKSESIYVNQTSCFVTQYGNLTFSDHIFDGFRTLNENIDDNVGVKNIYMSYQKWVENNGSEKSLPGIPYTPSQIIWLQYAATMCEARDYYYIDNLLDGPTSPPEFRVNVALRNSDYFKKDWNCTATSDMTRKPTCQLWEINFP